MNEMESRSGSGVLAGSAPEEGGERCHLCGSAALERADEYSRLRRVTSDCKPWPSGGILARCLECSLVQTVTSPEWERDAERIYRGYTIYHQSGGAEQQVFGGGDVGGAPRSDVIVEALRRHAGLPPRGRLLDVGCGNGSFLRAWSALLPGWTLAGSEVDDKYRDVVERIPGVERMYAAPLEEIPGTFDVISLVHVLEHIPSPRTILGQIREKLNPGGLLVVEVPDCLQNPFMLLVADHCSHFSVETLAAIVAGCGFEVLHATGSWVPKEVSLIARRAEDAAGESIAGGFEGESARILEGYRMLQEVRARVESLAASESFGLFGTSIAATWLDAETGGRAKFFVDEDPGRVGKEHMGRPILSPGQVPPGSEVFVALPHPIAGRIAERLSPTGYRLHLPPR